MGSGGTLPGNIENQAGRMCVCYDGFRNLTREFSTGGSMANASKVFLVSVLEKQGVVQYHK